MEACWLFRLTEAGKTVNPEHLKRGRSRVLCKLSLDLSDNDSGILPSVNRQELQQLSRVRARDAKALLDAGNYAGAYYMAGYSLE